MERSPSKASRCSAMSRSDAPSHTRPLSGSIPTAWPLRAEAAWVRWYASEILLARSVSKPKRPRDSIPWACLRQYFRRVATAGCYTA